MLYYCYLMRDARHADLCSGYTKCRCK
jgi:hypothetical protein